MVCPQVVDVAVTAVAADDDVGGAGGGSDDVADVQRGGTDGGRIVSVNMEAPFSASEV